MLERIGLRVAVEILTYPELMRKTYLPMLDKPAEEQEWDIVIFGPADLWGHAAASLLVWETDEGEYWRWIEYDPIYEDMWKKMARTVDKQAQEQKIQEMVQYYYDQALHLFIYSPLALYAINKDVDFIPYKSQFLRLKETSVTDNHWSVRGKNN